MIITGDAVVDWMPFLGDGYPEEWIGTLDALEQIDFTHMILGHGEWRPSRTCVFPQLPDGFNRRGEASRGRWRYGGGDADLGGRALAPAYEQGMSKYPLGRYRDRIEATIEIVYNKVVHTH